MFPEGIMTVRSININFYSYYHEQKKWKHQKFNLFYGQKIIVTMKIKIYKKKIYISETQIRKKTFIFLDNWHKYK